METAPTVVEQQQWQEHRHPLLLDAPVSHGELAQGVREQALQGKWPCDCLLGPVPQQGEPHPLTRSV